jgi:hypothetical protein
MFRKPLNKLLNPTFAKKFLMKEGFYTGVPKKKRRVHSSLIYRRILIIYTPN